MYIPVTVSQRLRSVFPCTRDPIVPIIETPQTVVVLATPNIPAIKNGSIVMITNPPGMNGLCAWTKYVIQTPVINAPISNAIFPAERRSAGIVFLLSSKKSWEYR